MRGWTHIGTIGPDRTIWLTDSTSPPPDDSILAFAIAERFRVGTLRARDVIERWIPHAMEPSLCQGDDVYLATAIGESAFDPAPSVTIQ